MCLYSVNAMQILFRHCWHLCMLLSFIFVLIRASRKMDISYISPVLHVFVYFCITFANVVGRMLCIHPCLSVCLFVCLSVSRITQKVMDGFEQNITGRLASFPRTIPLNFGDDPDSGSGFRIQNIIFPKSLSTQSLFLRAPYVDQERSESLCGETHNGKC